MTSPVEICNLALAKLGQTPIINLLEPQTREEELCKQWYDICRRSVINDSDWSFARVRARITNVVPEPYDDSVVLFDYGYALWLPGNVMRVLSVWRSGDRSAPDIRWERQGNYILSDYAELNIIYSRDVTNPVMFSPLFVDALAVRLAFEMSVAITQNQNLKEALWAEYTTKIQQATTMDSMQASTEQTRSTVLRGVRNRPATRGGFL